MPSYIETLEKIVVGMSKQLEHEKSRVAELEKEKAELKSLLEKNISTFINKKEEGILLGLPIFEAYQLEQQAKGVEDLNRDETSVGRLHNGDKRSFIFSQDAWLRALELRNQAKALKKDK
jgi:hypothetical protein